MPMGHRQDQPLHAMWTPAAWVWKLVPESDIFTRSGIAADSHKAAFCYHSFLLSPALDIADTERAAVHISWRPEHSMI